MKTVCLPFLYYEQVLFTVKRVIFRHFNAAALQRCSNQRQIFILNFTGAAL
jgi:hypothetical protein